MKRKSNQLYRSLLSLILVVALVLSSMVVTPHTTSKAATKPTLNHTKISILAGEKYALNVNNKMKNSSYKWTTSNKKIAIVTQRGVVTGVAKGSTIITCTVKTPKSSYQLTCKVTVTQAAKSATASTQKELDSLLRSRVSIITINTTETLNFVIPTGDYSSKKLIVDAPNSDITNNGIFSSIEIKQIKSDTWNENASHNKIRVYDLDSRIVVSSSSTVSIELLTENAKLKIQNNGIISSLNTASGANIILTGSSKNALPVEITAPNVTLQASIPLKIHCTTKFALTLFAGSENTTVQATTKDAVPTIVGTITIKVIIGSGSNSTEISLSGTDTSSSPTYTAPSNTRDTVFNDLNQSQIVSSMGAGWNLGNQLESVVDRIPNETNWGNPVISESLIKAVKNAGFKSIRIPVSYCDLIGPGPDYKINEAWLNRVQQIVDYCMDNGLYAIINVHGDGYYSVVGGWLYCGEDNQEAIQTKYKVVWQQIATKFKDYDEHLIFESMNEEFDNTYNDPDFEHYKNINKYNQIFLDTIRQSGGNNSMRWVLIPGWNTNVKYTVGDYGFELPTDTYLSNKVPAGEKRVMISVHYYEPWDFCGGETGEITQWGESATDINKTSTHTGQSVMAAQFKSLYDKFTSKGYPVIIGEYGSIDKTSFDSNNTYYRAYFAKKVVENSMKYGCIPVVWDNGYNGKYGFGLFDRTTAAVTQPEIIKAIMDTMNGNSTAGTATSITLDQTDITMSVGDDPVSLHTTITPANSTDIVQWTSSDETIATVSDTGVVRAYALGTATITATVNGHSTYCTINVKPTTKVKVGLYALETKGWSTIKSPASVTLAPEGGTYTLSLTGSKELLSNIGSLYLKDMQVQSGNADTTLFKNVKIKIDSVKFNSDNSTVTQTAPEEAVNNKGQLDFTILNQWATNAQKIQEATIGSTGSYSFTGTYQDINTIEVTFTTSDIVAGSSDVPTPPVTPTEPTGTATPISSIKYDFAISGVTNETSLIFKCSTSDYTDLSKDIALNSDGNYSITVNPSNVKGMVNMGYFETVSGSAITATLSKVTINNSYVLDYAATLKVGTKYDNGLKNIWSGLAAGDKLAEGTNGYLALNNDKSAFVFYCTDTTKSATATPISSIKYEFNVTGITNETSLSFTCTTSDYANLAKDTVLNGDGNYSITVNPNNAQGMVNMGFFTTIANSSIKATLTKITINDTYVLNYSSTQSPVEIASNTNNGLSNIWGSLTAGTKIAEGTNGYLALNSDKSAFVLYTLQ
ncbi:cellulase family glycosylhydrolase [Anaeromicropila herbilytica]|uniref:BIG2 domain-containing protein n=1 Tax=Anaeromicropila herbilytica TaxID=2785025 RepID=A0A7R7EIJ6_9FIRM|nr:cellulase family glycosylhydrolase [Anaeromicropila herbilytica]BCN29385.1 hypothetical protein bsdtb5_06800 [Anaeromicropila herbilytica]